MTARSHLRQGTLLILVAGISALLASLALAFMLRISAGLQSADTLARETQARLMLHAACAYILEASRLGYGPDRSASATGSGGGFIATTGGMAVIEGHGWIDTRESDGRSFTNPTQPGPRDQLGNLTYDPGSSPGNTASPTQGASDSATWPRWPAVGGVVICPMYRWTRPPYAIKPTVAYNPIMISQDKAGDARWGRPLLVNPDPQPEARNGWPGTVSDGDFSLFLAGDQTPAAASAGKAWFRVYRKSAATFLVTCGSGGTAGFKDWHEVVNADKIAGAPAGPALFNNDQDTFQDLLDHEMRTWYEVRWSAAIRPLDFRFEEPLWWIALQNAFGYRTYPVNSTQYVGWSRNNRYNPNPVGSISFVQRLEGVGGNPIDQGGPAPGQATLIW